MTAQAGAVALLYSTLSQLVLVAYVAPKPTGRQAGGHPLCAEVPIRDSWAHRPFFVVGMCKAAVLVACAVSVVLRVSVESPEKL